MKKVYKLRDLDCAVCAQKMEAAINKLDDVSSCSVSYITQKMTIDFNDETDEKSVMKNIVKLVKKIEPDCEIVL